MQQYKVTTHNQVKTGYTGEFRWNIPSNSSIVVVPFPHHYVLLVYYTITNTDLLLAVYLVLISMRVTH